MEGDLGLEVHLIDLKVNLAAIKKNQMEKPILEDDLEARDLMGEEDLEKEL